MEMQALRWFQQVADGATVTEVGELEMVSQPGVSRALARLESEVGAPLLQRHGRTLRMTHAGAAFKRHVDAVLHHLDDGLASVQQLIDPETGTVTVAFQPSLGSWLLPDLLRSFRRVHPFVRFDLRSKTDETTVSVGATSDVDLELSTLRPAAAGHEWQVLAREPLHLLVGADHPMSARSPGRRGVRESVGLAEVAGQPMVMLRHTSILRRQCEELCAAAGFEPEVALVADDLPTLRGFVAAGLGVAVAPFTGTPATQPGLTAIRLADPGAHRDVGLSWSRERRMLPAAELLRQHVLARAQLGSGPVATGRSGSVIQSLHEPI